MSALALALAFAFGGVILLVVIVVWFYALGRGAERDVEASGFLEASGQSLPGEHDEPASQE